MKKLVIFLILFIVSIPAFAQDKSLFTGNFSLARYSGDKTQSFFNLDLVTPVNHLFQTEEEYRSKRYQTFQILKYRLIPESIYFSKGSVIEERKQRGAKSPLRGGRIAGEILAGEAFAVAGGLALGYAGMYIAYLLTGDDEVGTLSIGFGIGGTIGFTFGSALGVSLIGNIGDETGSFRAALIGSTIGVAIGWVALIVEWNVHSILNYVAVAVPPILACIGFNKTRMYKSKPASDSALLNIREGKISLSIPTVYFYPDSYGRTLNLNISLMSVEL